MVEPDPFEKWFSSIYEPPSIGHKTIFELFAEMIVDLASLRPNDIILDVGTGTGAILKNALNITGSEGAVIGIDIDSSVLEKTFSTLKEFSDVQLYCMDAHHLEFNDNFFDVIFCGFAIDNFQDAVAVVKEFYRVLKPGGKVYISAWHIILFDQPGNDFNLKDLTSAGFQDIQTYPHRIDYVYPKFQDWYTSPLSKTHEFNLETLKPWQIEDTKKFLKEIYEPNYKSDGLHQIFLANFYSAVKPKDKGRKGQKGPKGRKGRKSDKGQKGQGP